MNIINKELYVFKNKKSLIVEGQNLNFALPGERIVKLKPSKAKTVAEWNAKPQKEKLSEVKGLLEKGKSFLWAGEYEKAISYFEKAVKKILFLPKPTFI